MADPADLPLLSVVIPIYNEEKRVAANLENVLRYLGAQAYTWELIFVEDGSDDRTRELTLEAIAGVSQARLISFPANRGKGFAVREGIMASRGRYTLFADVDLSVPIENVGKVLPLLEEGWEAVIASRAHPRSKILRSQPWWRYWGAWAFNAMRRRIVPSRFEDSQCGFKAFHSDLARQVFSSARVDGFLFDLEILDLLERQKRRVYELPVEWTHRDDSKVRVIRVMACTLRDLIAIYCRRPALF